MPTYEYRCSSCRRRVAIKVSTYNPPASPVCPSCGGKELKRLYSPPLIVRSQESRLEDLGDMSKGGLPDEKDPRSMARLMRKMKQEMGEELGPEFDETMERMEEGEVPEEMKGEEEEEL